MTKVFNIMMVSLMVESIKEKGYNCNVRCTIGEGENAETTLIKNVRISGLAKYNFANSENEKFVLGKEYASENNSKDYEKCPIKLIRTLNPETQKPSFFLKVVNQGRDTITEYTTPGGTVKKAIKFSSTPPTQWLRYSDYFERGKKKYLASLEEANA